MAGIYGMKVNNKSKEHAEKVMDGAMSWSTFKFDKDDCVVLFYYCYPSDNFSLCWELFIESLPIDDVNYGIVDFCWMSPNDHIKRSKRIFVLWAPEKASIRRKLIATMHLRDVKSQLTNGTCVLVLQANSYEDLEYNSVIKHIKLKTTVF